MVGITAIFGFLGIFMGFVAGMWWGFSQNWLIGITASAGGAVAGGITGCIAGFLGEEIPEWIRRLSNTHRLLGSTLSWAFWLLYVAGIVAFWYGGIVFLRHMRHHS
jgi:ABC-type dipeptide/oligopeptide/nickel transport system permease subunit